MIRRALRSARQRQLVALASVPLALVGVAIGVAIAESGPQTPGPTPTPSIQPSAPPSATPGAEAAQLLSPEASRIAYLQDTSNGRDLIVAYGDGSQPKVIAKGLDGGSSTIEWSPVGDELAVCGAPDRVVIVGIGGNDRRDIPNLACDHLEWSYNGELLAFSGRILNGPSDIYVVNRDGTGLRNLTNSPGSNEAYVSWAPESTDLAFLRFNSPSQADVFTVSLRLSAVHAITNEWTARASPVWDPDGRFLWVEGVDGIFTIPLTGMTSEPQLAIAGATGPVWSPDKRRFAYIERQADPPNDRLMIAESGGTRLTEVLSSARRIRGMSWSPDGKELLYELQETGPGTHTTFIMRTSGDVQSREILEPGSRSPAWSPRQAIPATSLRSLVPKEAVFERAAFVNMNASEYGQIAVETSESASCRVSESAENRSHHITLFNYSKREEAWVQAPANPADAPVVPPDPCVSNVRTNLFPFSMKGDGTEQLVVVAYVVIGNHSVTHIRVVGADRAGRVHVLYSSEEMLGDIEVSAVGAELSLEVPLYGPRDLSWWSSAFKVSRLAWDPDSSTVVTKHIRNRLRCNQGRVDLVNFLRSYLVVYCVGGEAPSGPLSAFFDGRTVFQGGLVSASDLHVGQLVNLELPPNVSLAEDRLVLSRISLLEDLTMPGSAPPMPGHFRVTSPGCCLAWDASPGATEYRIEIRRFATDSWTELERVIPPGLEWTYWGPLDAIPFYREVEYRIVAWNKAGESEPTPSVTLSLGEPPASPTLELCQPPSGIVIQWTPDVGNPMLIHFEVKPVPTQCSGAWSWVWFFDDPDDGGVASLPNGGPAVAADHEYPGPGRYNVQVLVSNSAGECYVQQLIDVIGPTQTPTPAPSGEVTGTPVPTAAPTPTPAGLPATGNTPPCT